MNSRKVLIVTNKMSTVNKIYDFLIRRCFYNSDFLCDSMSAGYRFRNASCGNDVVTDITIITVSNAVSEEYKSHGLYDRVIIDSVFEYDGDKEIIKIFEKCAKHLYDVVDIDLSNLHP